MFVTLKLKYLQNLYKWSIANALYVGTYVCWQISEEEGSQSIDTVERKGPDFLPDKRNCSPSTQKPE